MIIEIHKKIILNSGEKERTRRTYQIAIDIKASEPNIISSISTFIFQPIVSTHNRVEL